MPITGYKLYMSQGTSEYTQINEGSENALVRWFEVTDLLPGGFYQFKVAAANFNGDSESSDALEVYSCLPPSKPTMLKRVSGSRTSLTLSWQVPCDDGGCPLTGYSLFRNDGSQNGPVSIEVDAAVINGKPSYLRHSVIFLATDTGKKFRF